jgi:hypothetical protein
MNGHLIERLYDEYKREEILCSLIFLLLHHNHPFYFFGALLISTKIFEWLRSALLPLQWKFQPRGSALMNTI